MGYRSCFTRSWNGCLLEIRMQKKFARNASVIVLLTIFIVTGQTAENSNSEEARVTEREAQIGYLMEVARETTDPSTRMQIQAMVRDLEAQR
jgi:uncharacterized protein (DUF2342 family)